MIPAPVDPVIANAPNILVDRVLTAIVFCLIIHSGVLYSLQLLFDIYHSVFYFDLPQIGVWKVLRHPFQFFFTSLFSLGWIFLVGAIAAVTWISYRRLNWAKSFIKYKYWKLKVLNFIYGVCYFCVGIFLAIAYLRFMQRKYYVYSDGLETKSSNSSPTEISYVDERYSFVLQSCGIAASYFYIKFLSTCNYAMKFPPIETSTLIRLRNLVFPTLREATWLSGNIMIFSYLTSFICGPFFHSMMCTLTFGRMNTADNTKLSHLSDYFDVELLFVIMICQVLVAFTLQSIWLTMEIIVTQRVKFRIDTDSPGVSSIGLRDMMSSSDIYLKKLAYYDLKLLTEFDDHRMIELFTLSHPGGFPKIWNSVSKSCLEVIQKMIKDLKNYVDKADAGRRIKEVSSIDTMTERLLGPRAKIMNSPNELVTGAKLRSRFGVAAMRSLNLPVEESAQASGDTNGHAFTEILDNPFAPVINLLTLFFDILAKYALKLLSTLNLMRYFEDDTDTEVSDIFADHEMVLWAVCGLSDVVISSCRIDSKGVVQPDICLILTTLTNLCTALDDLKSLKDGGKVDLFSSRVEAKILVPNTYVKKLIQLVRKPLKNEIMRIHTTYQRYYDIISVPPSCEQKLKKLTYYD